MDSGVELSRFGVIVALFGQDLVLHYDNTPIQYNNYCNIPQL